MFPHKFVDEENDISWDIVPTLYQVSGSKTALNKKTELAPAILQDIPEGVKQAARKPVIRQ